MKIVAMTELCVDFYERQGIVRAGGSSLNFATQCKKKGVGSVSILGAVGTDSYGETILEHMDRQGIERSRVRKMLGRTAANRVQASMATPLPPEEGPQNFALSDDDWAYVSDRDLVAIPASDRNFREALRRIPPRAIVVDFKDNRDFKLMEESIPAVHLAFVDGDDLVCDRLHQLSQRCDTAIVVRIPGRGWRVFQHGEVRVSDSSSTQAESDPVREAEEADAYKAAFCLSYWNGGDIRTAMEAGLAASAGR